MKRFGMPLLAVVGLAMSACGRESLLFVSAHPDDTDGFAATALLLKDKFDIHVVDMTHGVYDLGEKGVFDDPRVPGRMKEEFAACSYAGFTPHFLSESDADACASDKSATQLAEIIRKVKPRAVFTHWPIDRHADHVQCAALVARALVRAGRAPAPGQKMPPDAAERYFFEEWMTQTLNFTPLYSVDVSKVMTNKVEMLRLYKGQNPGNMLAKLSLERASLRGSQHVPPCRHAEVFTSYDGKPVPGGVLEKLKETVILNEAQSKKQ